MHYVNAAWPASSVTDPHYSDGDESSGDEEHKIKTLELRVNLIAEKYLRDQRIASRIMIGAAPLQEAGRLQIIYKNEEEIEDIEATITDPTDLEQINWYKNLRDAWKRNHTGDVPHLSDI